jgi:hypothetical protein
MRTLEIHDTGMTSRWKVGRIRILSAGVQTSAHRFMVPGNLQPGDDDAGNRRESPASFPDHDRG